MKKSLKLKLDIISERYEEIGMLLGTPDVLADQNKFRKLSQEYAEIESVVHAFKKYCLALENIKEAEVLMADSDPEMQEMGREEFNDCKSKIEGLELALQKLMLPKDPNDGRNVFLEIRAGTGGDEASIFAGDLYRMYSRYADSQKWTIEVINENQGDHGGYKEIICRVTGANVYSQLKFESGAHRVQRVPETESQGRVHTSACTVAVMAELDDLEEINIRPEDLRVDTYRSSGSGGQHVNTTDSAIRLTHLPTGVVVECQEERSQHKNKARAMSWLAARLQSSAEEARHKETSDERRSLVGSGDRSERIRTYNFPQGRVTDHRINLTLYKLNEVVQGQLGDVLQPLMNEYQADQLAALSE